MHVAVRKRASTFVFIITVCVLLTPHSLLSKLGKKETLEKVKIDILCTRTHTYIYTHHTEDKQGKMVMIISKLKIDIEAAAAASKQQEDGKQQQQQQLNYL